MARLSASTAVQNDDQNKFQLECCFVQAAFRWGGSALNTAVWAVNLSFKVPSEKDRTNTMERGRMNRAQSSRLSEMPMRVVDSNRTSMVYTTPKSCMPSFGKLNIPKPQSHTSERRTSFFGARASGAGMPRNSSIGGFGGSEKLKDVRPLHDKAFVQQCVRQLSEFLSENGFLGSVSTKMLQSPSTKEFLKMFEFIYSQLDNTFQLPTSKVEEEVPRLLKDMGYPFAISKSSMYSVGAPHTWPLVLGALIWLIDTVKIYWCMSREELLFSDFSDDMNIDDGQMNIEDGPEYNKMFLDYTVETYGKYLQGADTFEDEDEVHFHKLKALYNVDEVQLASLDDIFRKLSDKVAQLESERQADPLMSKRIQKMELQADLKKLQSFRSSMEALKSSMEAKALEVTDEQEAAGHQLESLKQEQERLQVVLKNQKFTPADVERINREKNELQQTISSLSKSLEEAEQHMWNEEIAVIKAKEKAELKLTEYHKLARKLKLIPASAENACGHDYEIRANLEIGPSTMVQYKTQVMVRLRDLIGNVEEEASQLTNQKLSVEESIEQVNCNLLDKSNDLKQLRENIRKLDQQVEQDMEEVARDEQKWAEELESLENHRKLLEKNVNIGHDKAVRELKAAQQQYHLVLQETNEERRSVANHLTSAISIAAEHLDMVESCLEELNDKVKRALSKATEEDTAELRRLQDMSKAFIAKAQSL
ncbi:kinetochore protein NDC80 homolog isoform X2 [Gadus morhua]|uniref:kinetochore protein NDC80 homolog isoform X2 n=1 Tax=Gadus morhua TaxID=8049 RepID=UPI0011B4AB00|nr:kinetochore protein NDC80 homolog isoform X2 [Gadus morhua]